MGLRTKLEILFAVVGITLLSLSFSVHRAKEAAVSQYKAQEVHRVQEALTKREEASKAAVAATKDKNYKGRAEVEAALQESTAWGSERTPAAVHDSLCRHIKCTGSSGTIQVSGTSD